MTPDEIYASVGKGWHSLLEEVLTKIPASRIDCVKEKFGKLRVCAMIQDETPEEVSSEMLFLIDVEHRSGVICETCGNPGQLVDRAGWMKVLCEECGCGLRTIEKHASFPWGVK